MYHNECCFERSFTELICDLYSGKPSPKKSTELITLYRQYRYIWNCILCGLFIIKQCFTKQFPEDGRCLKAHFSSNAKFKHSKSVS